eukprot:EG_transcript_31998
MVGVCKCPFVHLRTATAFLLLCKCDTVLNISADNLLCISLIPLINHQLHSPFSSPFLPTLFVAIESPLLPPVGHQKASKGVHLSTHLQNTTFSSQLTQPFPANGLCLIVRLKIRGDETSK